MKIIDNSTFFPWDLICEVDDLLLHRVQAKHLHGSGEILKMSLDIRKLLSSGICRKFLMEWDLKVATTIHARITPAVKSVLWNREWSGHLFMARGLESQNNNWKFDLAKNFSHIYKLAAKTSWWYFLPSLWLQMQHTDSALNGKSRLHRLENVL